MRLRTWPSRDHVSSHVQVYYTYPENVPNLLALGFVIQAMMQALLVIGSSDITVTERSPGPADAAPEPVRRCVSAALTPRWQCAGAQTSEQLLPTNAGKLRTTWYQLMQEAQSSSKGCFILMVCGTLVFSFQKWMLQWSTYPSAGNLPGKQIQWSKQRRASMAEQDIEEFWCQEEVFIPQSAQMGTPGKARVSLRHHFLVLIS